MSTKKRNQPKKPARGQAQSPRPLATLLHYLLDEIDKKRNSRIVIKEVTEGGHPHVLWAGTPSEFLNAFSINL